MSASVGALRLRTHGAAGPWVVLLHGGPGAPGYLAPLACALADSFRVWEPWQRPSGAQPLTVARHVADLQELLAGEEDAPVLVGHSWGAMLALAYAAAHPGRARGLALIGCGTFDARSRALLEATVERRMDAGVRRRLEALGEIADPDLRLRRLGELMLPVYSCELAVDRLDMAGCDARAHEETWNDMRRLQEAGIYPASFAAIHVPILMLHGAADPHPGRRIEATLRPYLPQLEYREWGRCGHYPWLERNARDEFLAVLREWLLRKS